MAVLYTNNAASLLSASITNAATSFSVTSGQGALFPALTGSDYFYVTLLDTAGNIEIVKVTGRSTDTFTVARGQDGTSARAWAVGDKVELRIVRAMLDDLKGERLPLTGGTLTGTDVVLTIRDDAASNDGSWRGRIVSKNVTSGVASFLGNYQGKAGVYAHSAALDAWADLYVNTSNGSGGGAVRMTTSVFMGGNQALHAGNYTDYAAPASHTHSYLPLGGGTLTGKVIAGSSDGDSIEVRNDTASAASSGYITFKNKNGIGVYRPAARISGVNVDNAYDGDFLIETYSGGVAYKGLRVDENSNVLFYDTSGNVKFQWDSVNSRALINSNVVLHAGNYSSYAAPASHTHSYLPLSGGTVTGALDFSNANVRRTISKAIDNRGVWDGSLNGYLLLAKAYVSGIQDNSEVTGRIFLSRGSTGEGRRTETIEVYSKSAYNSENFLVNWPGGRDFTAGTLHKVTYGGTVYHAIRLGQYGGGPYQGFVFDGYTTNAGLIVALDSEVSNVTSFGNTGYVVGLDGVVYASGNIALHAGNYTNYTLPLSGGTLTGNRPISFATDGGSIFIKGDTGGWGMGLYFKGSDDVVKGSFGALGGGAGFSYLWAGLAYNDTWMTWNSSDINANKHTYFNTGATFYQDGSSRAMYLRGSGNIIQFCDQDGTFRWENVGRNGTYYIYKGYGTGSGYKFQINDIGEVRINGDIAVTAGNYTNYSPSLTGSGASGTWNINTNGTHAGTVNDMPSGGNSLSGMGIATSWDARPQGVYDRFSINWHTGISLGGYPGYGGVRLYAAGYPTLSSSVLRLEASDAVYTYGNLYNNGNQVLHAGNSQNYKARSLNSVRTSNVDFNSLNTAVDTFTAGTNYIPSGGAYNQPADGDHHYLSWGGIDGASVWGAQIDINFYDDRMWFRRQSGSSWQGWRNVLHDGNYNSYALPLSGGTLTGSLTVGRDVIVVGQTGGNYGNRIVVGAYDTAYTLQDTNLRPTIQANGQYPVLSLNHTVTSNTNHGPTIQMTANGVGNQFVIGMTGNGTALDMGYSSTSDWNPHNGIAGYSGTTFFRATSGGFLGLGAPGDWGGVGGGDPQYHLHVKGYPTWTQGYAGVFQNTGGSNGGGWLFQNDAGNHSWGATAEFRVNGTGDRPSIIFSTAAVNTSWSIGYVTGSDDTFRISKNHGHRAYYNGWADNNSGWGTAYFSITSSGVASANGGTLLSSSNYTNYTNANYLPWQTANTGFTVGGSNATFYPVVLSCSSYYTNGWNQGFDFEIFRDDVHENFTSAGTFRLRVFAQPSDWGHRPGSVMRVEYKLGYGTYADAVGDVTPGHSYEGYIIVWLRGGMTYHLKSLGWNYVTCVNANSSGASSISTSYGTFTSITSQGSVITAAKNGMALYGYPVLTGGNYSSYALPLSGGTMSGAITMGGNNVNNAGQFSLNNGFTISQGGSNYGQFSSWVHLPGYHGLYSTNNGAHFYPNDGSYGAWRIQGSRNGWRGITFDGSVTLMMNDNESGHYKDGYGWQFRWYDGTLRVGKNSYGGNEVIVLDASNYTNYTLPIGGGWYGSGLPGSRWGGYAVSGGEIAFGNGLPNAGQMGILVDGCYVAGENNGFWSLAGDNTWGSRRGMYWDGSYLNFTTNTPTARFQALYIDGGGTYLGVNYFLSNKGAGTYVGGQNNYSLQAFSNDAGAAGMSFHRGGYYAINMGLDPDNVLRIGGWSASANLWQLDAAGNNYVAGNFYAGNSNLVLHAGNYTNYLGDYTYGNYRVIADYSSANTWYIRSNGRFTWARAHDWSQSYDLNLGNGTTNGNDGWAKLGQVTSNTANGTWFGTRFVQYSGGSETDGYVRAGRYYLGNDSYYASMGDWGLRNTTPYGWIQFGPANSSWAHIYSSGLDFYFNANLYTNGWIQIHSSNVGNYALDVNGGTMYGNATFQRSTDSAIDFYHSATPSGTSNRVIAGSSFVARNNAGTYQTMAVRRVRAITSSTSSSYGIVVDEAYVSNALNAYTNLLQDQWSFYSSYSGSLVKQFAVTGTEIGPGAAGVDNTMSAGGSTRRYSVVYAVTGTINTSDVNEKEQIQDLDAAERRVAVAVKGLIKKFKWKDAVSKKGDAARIHIGVIAQEVEAAFVAEGLDPERYALFCKDVWWEKMVPNENYGREDAPNEPETILETFKSEVEGGTRKERKGIRYDQLLAFVISAI